MGDETPADVRDEWVSDFGRAKVSGADKAVNKGRCCRVTCEVGCAPMCKEVQPLLSALFTWPRAPGAPSAIRRGLLQTLFWGGRCVECEE